ncbi:hypothetical protein NIES267_02340 [Calothrix parasitica NIES-267]|uniref:Uncharacterized protein n=1 Tax=Calothrix parasitica NIES-267 TaxID=1973488 RepID=A0A1Z4LHW2_9CYAN|nr:hypothetical protein NIES267_02340 [Calothrix parasitica NIES-267]
MTFVELKNHQIWNDLTDVLENIDANALIKEHLELCHYKVYGYWDEIDNYYEEIILPNNLQTELISTSIGVNVNQRFIQMKFTIQNIINDNYIKIGELSLIYSESLDFIDENWNLDSDYLELNS